MSLDAIIVRYVNGFVGKSPLLDGVVVFFSLYVPYLTAAAFFIFLFAAPSQKIEIFLVAAMAAIVARFVITEGIRLFYKRPRPFVSHKLKPLVSQHQWSFPSGHAAFFFALAGVAYQYDSVWGIGFFFSALLMTVSRVIAGVHYPSDILSGALIGVLAAYGSAILVASI